MTTHYEESYISSSSLSSFSGFSYEWVFISLKHETWNTFKMFFGFFVSSFVMYDDEELKNWIHTCAQFYPCSMFHMKIRKIREKRRFFHSKMWKIWKNSGGKWENLRKWEKCNSENIIRKWENFIWCEMSALPTINNHNKQETKQSKKKNSFSRGQPTRKKHIFLFLKSSKKNHDDFPRFLTSQIFPQTCCGFKNKKERLG